VNYVVSDWKRAKDFPNNRVTAGADAAKLAAKNEKRPEKGVLLRALRERSLAPDKRPAYFENAGQSPL
jgi:hypothetical protein